MVESGMGMGGEGRGRNFVQSVFGSISVLQSLSFAKVSYAYV